VQGVYFRAETCRRAEEAGVAGWVRNLPDGSVEAVLEGEEEAVSRLIAWSRRGPDGARVDAVDVTWEQPQRETGFGVRG
jgi:acylphosphatase